MGHVINIFMVLFWCPLREPSTQLSTHQGSRQGTRGKVDSIGSQSESTGQGAVTIIYLVNIDRWTRCRRNVRDRRGKPPSALEGDE